MKRIGIDYQPVENSPAGIGQYELGLIKGILELDKSNEYIIYSTKEIAEHLTTSENPNVKNTVFKWPNRFPLKGLRWMNKVVKDLYKERVDIFLSFSNNYFANVFPRTIQFVCDLAPMHFPKYYKLNARLLYASTTKLALEKGLHIITISEAVKKELVLLGKTADAKISVVNPFVNENIFENQKTYTEIPQDSKYILTISTLEPKKNMVLGIQAFSELINNPKFPEFKDFKYFIIGKKGWHYEEIFETVEELGLSEKVIFLGYVDDKYIADIISRSKCMLLLSKYEGFGIPPLESLYFNVPVVVSDIPVFREVLSDMATYVDVSLDLPRSPTLPIAQALANAINSARLDTKDKVTTMYNAKKSAKQLLEIIEQY
jgi:glycosyltransferase involved in cell wall biosynthesis